MIPAGLPPLNIASSSSAHSGNTGDTFFGSVSKKGDFDWIGRVAIPLGVSVAGGLVLFAVSRGLK